MARRRKPEPASQQSVDRLALDMSRRFELTASQESVDAVKTALDRHIASMDRVAGELLDNRRSLLVFDSMLGDHRRRLDSHDHRLTTLASRHTPPNP